MAEHTFKYGSKELAESVPHGFNYIRDVLKAETEGIQPVSNALAEPGYRFFYPVPCADNSLTESLICVPQMHKGSSQRTDHCHHRHNRCGYASDSRSQFTHQAAHAADLCRQRHNALCQG